MKRVLVLTTLFIFSISMVLAGTPQLDGFLDAAAGYIPLATALPGDRTGFGPNIDASAIYVTYDSLSIYFFIQGKVNISTDSGILFLVNSDKTTGTAAGISLGNIAGGSHVFSNTGNNNWKMDFEVDRAFVGYPVAGPFFHIDGANYIGGIGTGNLVGNANMIGTLIVSDPVSSHAFDNAGIAGGLGFSTGWEIAIDKGALNYPDNVEVYAIVVSSLAFFSDDASPVTFLGNAGFNPDFGAGGYTGTIEHTSGFVPVELSEFGSD